jgi:hypothetical protein
MNNTENFRYLHWADTQPLRPCFPPTQAPRSRGVPPPHFEASTIASGSHPCCTRPSGSVLRLKLRNHCGLILWPNQQTLRTRHGLTTLSSKHMKPFTSGAQTVYSVLPHSLTWPPPLHRLHVHDFVLLFLHHADRTWSRRLSGPSNQAYLSLHHPKATLAKTSFSCSSPTTTQTKSHPASAILGQESVHSMLSITHYWEATIHWSSNTPSPQPYLYQNKEYRN